MNKDLRQDGYNLTNHVINKDNLTDIINSSFTFSKNYKKPNFNDLFWEPFGDPNLKTEFRKNLFKITSNGYGYLE